MPPTATATPAYGRTEFPAPRAHYPTAKRRGHRDRRECDPPPRVITPKVNAPANDVVIAALIRARRERDIGFRAHGAMTVVCLLDALYYEAGRQRTSTPRTGGSPLAWLMAKARGWSKRRADQMIDSHKHTLNRARDWCVDAGLLTYAIAVDELEQARGTDWTLLGTPDVSPER